MQSFFQLFLDQLHQKKLTCVGQSPHSKTSYYVFHPNCQYVDSAAYPSVFLQKLIIQRDLLPFHPLCFIVEVLHLSKKFCLIFQEFNCDCHELMIDVI